MQAVVTRKMQRAYARVVKDKGVAGVDNMSVAELKGYIKTHWPEIKEQQLRGSYPPRAVLRVEIPKENGASSVPGLDV